MEPRRGTIFYVEGTILSDQALGRGVVGKAAVYLLFAAAVVPTRPSACSYSAKS